MNKLALWIIRREVRKDLKDGFENGKRLTAIYDTIREVVYEQAKGSRDETIKGFLDICFRKSQRIRR